MGLASVAIETPGYGASSKISDLQHISMRMDKLYIKEEKAKSKKIGIWENKENINEKKKTINNSYLNKLKSIFKT